MTFVRILLWAGLAAGFATGGESARAQSAINTAAPALTTNPVSMTTAPVYVPDVSLANKPMSNGVLDWNALQLNATVTNEQPEVVFAFIFTNVSGGDVTMVEAVKPSCGCTTAELPPIPWTVPNGSNGVIKLTVNLEGKADVAGMIYKSADVFTDRGSKRLLMNITVLPPPPMRTMSDKERAAAMRVAKVDRQAVFKGGCAECHLPRKRVDGKWGQTLYDSLCAVCHDAERRATIVPDLHKLTVPTNEEYWRTWITLGKPGTFMPAFATSQGGPLSDMQIASLAAYLNAAIPSTVTNAPAK